jgi:hypothetical protein
VRGNCPKPGQEHYLYGWNVVDVDVVILYPSLSSLFRLEVSDGGKDLRLPSLFRGRTRVMQPAAITRECSKGNRNGPDR